MDTKDEKTDGYTERTRLGVRYPELFSFKFSSIRSKINSIGEQVNEYTNSRNNSRKSNRCRGCG